MNLSNQIENFNFCLEIIGPIIEDKNCSNKSLGTFNFNYVDNVGEDILLSFQEGQILIDSLVESLDNNFSEGCERILTIFNRFVENEQPICEGIYIITRLLLCDQELDKNYYSRTITFCVHCINNRLTFCKPLYTKKI